MDRSRKHRSKNQKIFLVQCHNSETAFEKKYDVMGTTGNVYTVTINNTPICTCPDFMTRHKRCKHIYFVLIKIMHIEEDMEDSKKYSNEDLTDMFNSIPEIMNNLIISDKIIDKYNNVKDTDNKKSITVEQRAINDLCPICLDDLDNGSEIDYCKFSCGNNVHKDCMNMWLKIKKNLCVFCKKPWNNTVSHDYINLL